MNWASVLVAVALTASAASADIYMYRDHRGGLHFSQTPAAPNDHDKADVPPASRHRAKEERERLPSWGDGLRSLPMKSASDQPLEPSEIFRRVAGSVYAVVAMKGLNRSDAEASLGSAVAVSNSTLITNCHLVAGAEHIMVKQANGQTTATLVKADPISDRCVIEVEGTTVDPVSGVRAFADLSVGERVYTIGTPGGLERTLGDGLVSGLRVSDDLKLIQTSAPISPGSSGGGLFDARGNLVGITTFLLRDAQALNFAIAAEEFWAGNLVSSGAAAEGSSRQGQSEAERPDAADEGQKKSRRQKPAGVTGSKNKRAGPYPTPMDFLPAVREGDITMLNNKAEQFAPFVRRVAMRVFENFWMTLRRSVGTGFAESVQEYAVIEAVMDKEGRLVSISLKDRSGSISVATDRNLQNACREGFFDRAPPSGAEANDGKIHFIFQAQVQLFVDPRSGGPTGGVLMSVGLL